MAASSTFNLTEYFQKGFKNVGNDAASIRSAAQAILDSQGKFSAGNSSYIDWANMAMSRLNKADEILKTNKSSPISGGKPTYATSQEYAQAQVDDAYRWITGGAQSHKASRVLEKYNANKSDLEKKIQNELSNIANITDFSGGNVSAEEQAKLNAAADKRRADLAPLIEQAKYFGISVDPKLTRTASGFIPTSEATPAQKAPAAAPTAPAAPTVTAKPANDAVAGLFSRVEATTGNLSANKEFVNAAFKAYHGRDANAQELANFTGKTVDEVRNTIKAGIPGGAASPTVTAASAGSSPSTATPKDADLAAKVEAAQGGLTANKDFVNAAFRAFHGRDATAAELAQFTGQSVNAVRTAVKAGAPGNAAGGTAAAPAGDRLLGPTEYEKLRKQYGVSDANFDQFFRRDANGNIYLKADAFANRAPFVAASASDINTPTNAGDMFRSEFDMNYLSSGGDNLTSFVAGLNALWEISKTDTQKRLETERADLTSSLKEATAALKNKGTRTREEEEKLGLTANTKALQEINTQIARKMAEYQAADLKIRQQPITTGLIEGQQRQLMEQKAVDMGVLFMQQAALNDNITLAQEIAGHIVDLEFAPIEQEIANATTFLEMNSQDLTREEAKQASRIESVLAERSRILEEQKAEKQLIAGLMIDVAKAGGDPRILNYGASFEENLAKASPYLVTPADTKRDTQVVELADGTKYLVDLQTGERIASFGDTNDNGSLGFDSWLSGLGGSGQHTITQDFANPADYIAGRDIHGGLDIDGIIGDPLTAPVSGRVISAGEDGGWGNSIVIEDAAGNRWRMAHMDSIAPNVKPGGYVGAGMSVGTLGNTGHVEATGGGDGSHLHLEVKGRDGNLIDPRQIMTPVPQKPVTPEQAAQEQALRKEFNALPITSQYNDLRTSFTSMQTAYDFATQKPDGGSKAAADQALVTLFNKMLDPTSVVREGEYARSFEGQSALARAQGYIEKITAGGGGLTDENRKDMVDISKKLFASTTDLYTQTSNYYRGIAQQYGFDPGRVISPMFGETPSATGSETGGANLGDLNWGAGSGSGGSTSPYTVDLSDLNFIFGPTAP